MEFFYHPWYMAAGGALVSSPILIHLINRMRFKRVRWAAMEFLLKSQKRNRRKLIIEQMILLLLRILLVLLAAFLVARFVYGAGASRGATHVVIVDDTLSMFDRDFDGPKESIAYETAIEQVKEVAKHAAEASSTQFFKVYLLSEMDGSPFYDARLSDQSVQELDAKFATKFRKPSLMHVRPLAALQKGRQMLGDAKANEGQKILHFVSDFRDRDWSTGAEADNMLVEMQTIVEAGVNLNLIDVAAPIRNIKVKAVNHHNNVALVDLKADTRVAIEDADVEFTASIMNFGQAKESRFVEVFINGEKDLTRDMMLEDLEPGKMKEHKFSLRFQRRARAGMEITEKDTLEERERKRRLEREQFNVRVTVTKKGKDDDSIIADNIRDTVIELRRRIPILVVDGNKPEYRGNGGDMFHMLSFHEASKIYEAEERRLADLEKADLDLYPGIILLNVGEIPEAVVKKLRTYVDNGGSLTYFMGDEVKSDHYNTTLFKAGVFPLLIGNRPHDPLAAEFPDLEKRQLKRVEQRQTNKQPKILFPKPDNSLVQPLVPFNPTYYALSVNVYWQAQARSRWDPDLRQAEPLVVLPNTASMATFQGRALSLMGQARTATVKLGDKDPNFKRYIGPMETYATRVRNAIATQELYKLGTELEDLLNNPGVDKSPEKPSMADLWKDPEMKNLGAEISEFRERVLYGDPLMVAKQVGKGRVVAFLSTAGTIPRRGVDEDAVAWNNWGAGELLLMPSYPKLMLGLHQYMISEGVSASRTLGEEIKFDVDASRYAPGYTLTHYPQPESGNAEGKIKPIVEKAQFEKNGSRLSFALAGVRKPGVYTVSLVALGDGAEGDRTETRAYAFNVHAAAEGDLKRASTDRLLPDLPSGDSKRGKIVLRVPGGDFGDFKERQPDASESSLLYLFFMLILVVEQAMAVHLSYHTKAAEQGVRGAVPSSSAAA
jgi:Aerotolerance regulator N-terminal